MQSVEPNTCCPNSCHWPFRSQDHTFSQYEVGFKQKLY